MASAAKVPILVTFEVSTAENESENADVDVDDHQRGAAMKQALIFKVGDDTRQDVLALQVKRGALFLSSLPAPWIHTHLVRAASNSLAFLLTFQLIKLCKTIVQSAGLDLYLEPYSVLPTGYEQGIIQVVPDTESRTQAGELADGGLVDIFKQKFGAPGSPAFESARQNLIRSTAG